MAYKRLFVRDFARARKSLIRRRPTKPVYKSHLHLTGRYFCVPKGKLFATSPKYTIRHANHG